MIRSAAVLAIVSILAMASGCSDSSAPETDLVAHLSLSIEKFDRALPLTVEFVLDPTGTVSKLSPVESLEVRWDLDGDGSWDTEFEELHVLERAELPSVPFRTWSARCEVRDPFGNHSIAKERITLPDWLPLAPDLVVGELIVNDDSVWQLVHMDTLAVGSKIDIILPARMWGNHHTIVATIRCYIDGALVSEDDCWVIGPFPPFMPLICPQEDFTILEPGEHVIEAELVPPAEVEDADRTNNRSTATVVLIDADG
jgi:hypothetical protein